MVGGKWTELKLSILQDYISAYVKALKNQRFSMVYIDAFSGSGDVHLKHLGIDVNGSSKIALNVNPPFHEYYFIDIDTESADNLDKSIKREHPEYVSRCHVIRAECNEFLKNNLPSILSNYNRRGIILLDPFSLHVSFETLNIVASTEKLDVWYLFPLSAVNRNLPKDNLPFYLDKLRYVLGNDFGFDKIYHAEGIQESLFGDPQEIIWREDIDSIKERIIERLNQVFKGGVCKDYIVFTNSKNSPLFMLLFACSNPSNSARGLSMKIAGDIINKRK